MPFSPVVAVLAAITFSKPLTAVVLIVGRLHFAGGADHNNNL